MVAGLLVLGLFFVTPVSALSPPIVYVSANNDGDYNCDGVADQVQINQALAYVRDNAGFTTVYLKNDGGNTDYIIDDTIEVPTNTIFTGDVGAVVKLKADIAKPSSYEWSMVTGNTFESGHKWKSAYNITINNITFDADRWNQSNIPENDMDLYATIEIRGYDQTYHDLSFTTGIGDFIKIPNWIETTPDIEIYDNYFGRAGHCDVYVLYTGYTGSDRIWIHDNTFDYVACNAGVRLDECSGALVENNTFTSNNQGDHAIYLAYKNDQCNIGSHDNEIRYNEIYDVREHGILLAAEVSGGSVVKSEVSDNWIHHNLIYSTDGDDGNGGGVSLYGYEDTLIEYNTIHACDGDGIQTKEHYGSTSTTGFNVYAYNNIISGAVPYNSQGYGINNIANAHHNITSDYNNIYDCDLGSYGNTSAGSHDIYVDPKYLDIGNDKYWLKSSYGTWDGDSWENQDTDSACIDAADPADSYSNEPEDNANRANLGRWGNTIYASKSGAAEFNVYSGDFIQDAVDAATNGDTIIVYPGVYTENVDVYKKLTIISESGNPDYTIVQAASSNDHVFHVTADNVTINGFTATGVTGDDKSGISLYAVEGCTITNNIASNNDLGINLYDSSNNTIYNNYFNNTNNTLMNNSAGNVWNITKTAGTNIIGGSYLGGNYWAHPNGTGFSQTNNTDADRDGICDETYTIASDHIDYLPLAVPLVYPAANFTANVTEGIAPLTVSFTDLSTNATSWSWDIDADGTEDYSSQNIIHTYDTAGLYTVNLTV
ncbi:NosD domain-containing protein, partial [Methanococcoides sp. AM1]|uniref:NosD domain-containing protein n=1 Tax=Methanococcoides sp. AM1 TaxID=1201011 RepID=UPI001AEF4B5D